ncbi:hypothetical protein FN846DRAFT_893304 [Sphaerosporella brunnea]|uniref:Uncharacterized protein n=1 Tax=Sphaerosporella brunnea TaxID=1250544 RepID=A0A5J5EMY2_9PEZI|nr:hypothetical protein FN846DRAFT_893304 [Sphaerosporella brunnea]
MDVSRKRDNIYQSNAASGKRRKLNNGLSSGLDGGYWLRAPARRSTASHYSPPAPKLATEPQDNQLAIRQQFDVGLPVVFGQTSLPSPPRVQPYEIEEPESPPNCHSPLRTLGAPESPAQRCLLNSASDGDLKPQRSSYDWNFTPSWEAVKIGARILTRTLTFPFVVARYLVDVAPETRRQARLIEAARREQEQLLLEQWYTEHKHNRRSSSERSPSPVPPSPSSDNEASTMPAAGSSGSAGPSGAGQNRADDPEVRERALLAELHNMDVKRAAIDEERNLIRSGDWMGPTTPLSPTSIYVAPVAMMAGSSPVKARFNPSDLPQILFGEDLDEWISQMDHIVTSFGELVVCPHILHRCFVAGDPMRDWYLTKPAEVHLFVTTANGCWDRFRTLLRSRFKPDLGVQQYEADSYRKLPGDSWAAFSIRKYRLLKRAYEGSDNTNIILKMKAVMDTEVVRFCKEKSDIDGFIGELIDYDRTSPPVTRSPRRIFALENLGPTGYQPRSDNRAITQQAGVPNVGMYASRYQRDKGKAVDRSGMDHGSQERGGQDRKTTIQNRLNPETGKMVQSYLNFQGKPVFIKRACSICERNGKTNQMHFSFECPNNANPRTHAGEADDPEDELANQLYRTESGNLTSYSLQHQHVSHMTTLYHDKDDLDDDPESGNGQGGR